MFSIINFFAQYHHDICIPAGRMSTGNEIKFCLLIHGNFSIASQNETYTTETIRLRSYIQFLKDLVIELTGCCWQKCLLRVLWNPMEMLLGCLLNSMLIFLYHLQMLSLIIYRSIIWLKICIHAMHM